MHPVLVKAGISTILIIIFENKTILISKIVCKVESGKKTNTLSKQNHKS